MNKRYRIINEFDNAEGSVDECFTVHAIEIIKEIVREVICEEMQKFSTNEENTSPETQGKK